MRWIGIVLIVILAVFGGATRSVEKSTIDNKMQLIDEIDPSLVTGDIIFRTGTGFWSPYFATLDDKNGYSHAGMLLKSNSGLWFVVHAEANDDGTDGFVKKTPLHEFVAGSKKFEIKKNNMSPVSKKTFIASILKHLSRKTPFDSFFDINDGGAKVYCTELIWLSAKIAGIYDFGSAVEIGGRDFITVDSIYHSPYLQDSAGS
jgi:hypothetical protein